MYGAEGARRVSLLWFLAVFASEHESESAHCCVID